MLFCPECSNLLYPKEDRETKQLLFRCRSCSWNHYADPLKQEDNCVDTINFNQRSIEDLSSYIVKGLIDDPTLPRVSGWLCEKCHNRGAVFFQLPERVKSDAMTLVFMCENRDCTHYVVQGKKDSHTQRVKTYNEEEAEEPQGSAERDQVADRPMTPIAPAKILHLQQDYKYQIPELAAPQQPAVDVSHGIPRGQYEETHQLDMTNQVGGSFSPSSSPVIHVKRSGSPSPSHRPEDRREEALGYGELTDEKRSLPIGEDEEEEDDDELFGTIPDIK